MYENSNIELSYIIFPLFRTGGQVTSTSLRNKYESVLIFSNDSWESTPGGVLYYLTIKGQCCPHIENSQLICCANQLTGFYIRATLALNELNYRLLYA